MPEIIKRKILTLLLCAVLAFSLVPCAFSFDSQAEATAYSQYDGRWASWVYGQGTIAGTGCGILSTVNAFNYLNEISDVGASINEIATWAHDINGYNGTWDPSGGTDRTVVYPRLEAKFGEKYNITVPAASVWADINSPGLKKHLTEYGNVAIAHVAYGHFIVLAEYDEGSNRFLVLDSAPTVSGNTLNGVAWLPPEQLNNSGNSRMHVDWYCLISSTKSVEPTEKQDGLYLTEGDSVNGFWGEFASSVELKTVDQKTGIYISNPGNCTDNNAGVGSMAILKYSNSIFADSSDYNALSADIWCSEDYSSLAGRKDDYFQINLISDIRSQDGYNINISAQSIKKGWNRFVILKSDISPAVESADWTSVGRMRFTWFNMSNGAPVDFAVNNVKFVKEKVTARQAENSLVLSDLGNLTGFSAQNGGLISLSKQTDGGYAARWENSLSEQTSLSLSFYLDEAINANSFNKFTFKIKSSENLSNIGRKSDTVDIILTKKGCQAGYQYTVKGFYFTGSWQTLNFELSRFTQKDPSVDLSDIDTVTLVYTNKNGGQNADFYLGGLSLTDKKTDLYGDADSSGTVTVGDALIILQKSVGKIDFDGKTLLLCDVDCDGDVTVNDALCVRQKAVGKLDKFKAEE